MLLLYGFLDFQKLYVKFRNQFLNPSPNKAPTYFGKLIFLHGFLLAHFAYSPYTLFSIMFYILENVQTNI